MNIKEKIKELSDSLNIPEDNFILRDSGIIEWKCEHNVGHPVFVPDNIKSWGWIHGCDGCCSNLK